MGDVPNIHCPRCGSTDVECSERPHVHRCATCGYDGTTAVIEDALRDGTVDPREQTLALRETIATQGTELDRLRTENAQLRSAIAVLRGES